MKTIKLGVALCAALVIAVPAVANAVPGDSNGDPYVAPSYGSEKNIEAAAAESYVLADAPQEKFVSPAGVLRAGVTPNGDLALAVAAYSTELDGVCTQVGQALDGGDNEQIALVLDEAVSDVKALATPVDLAEFQAELVDLTERQVKLLRTLPQASTADALGAELEQIDVDVEDLFAHQGGFEVCGQA